MLFKAFVGIFNKAANTQREKAEQNHIVCLIRIKEAEKNTNILMIVIWSEHDGYGKKC